MTVQQSIIATATLVLIYQYQNEAHAAPAVQTTRQTLHFSVKLEQKEWFNHLLNPCNHDTSENNSSEDVLRVSGRETEIRTITGTTLTRLTSIKKHLLEEVQSVKSRNQYFSFF